MSLLSPSICCLACWEGNNLQNIKGEQEGWKHKVGKQFYDKGVKKRGCMDEHAKTSQLQTLGREFKKI